MWPKSLSYVLNHVQLIYHPKGPKHTPLLSINFSLYLSKRRGSFVVDVDRHGKMGGSGWVIRVAGRVGLIHIFHIIFFFLIYKENNMYLPFGKSCNKLLSVKCITLNSLLISKMNSVKLINTYSIILKLYKS